MEDLLVRLIQLRGDDVAAGFNMSIPRFSVALDSGLRVAVIDFPGEGGR
ncbi:hypothetical protein [Chitiniphilus eburneus]|nr:hypothetical protein [Chitiniphilus eburneus]